VPSPACFLAGRAGKARPTASSRTASKFCPEDPIHYRRCGKWLTLSAALLSVAFGCRSNPGGGWNPFARSPAPPSQPAAQTPPGQQPVGPNQPPGQPPAANQPPAPGQGAPAGQGVVQASYEKPQYVPSAGLSPADLLQNENLDEYVGTKKSWLEKSTEKLAPAKIGKGIKKAIGRGPNELLAKNKYEEGDALFRQGKYKEAAKCFKIAAARWPDSTLEEDSLYMLAESYFFDDRYPKASDTYAALIKKYENTSYLINIVPRQFAIARYWDMKARLDSHWYPNMNDKTRPLLDATGHAISVYNSVHLNDPQGPLGDDAMMAIGNSYFLRNRFEDACYNYDLVRKEYPQSEHQRAAHLLSIRSKLRSYQGPQYEVSPLEDADKLIEETLQQFPAEILGDERERLMVTRQLIRQEKAQREFQAGEYYYKIHYYGAARYHYAETIREFADTPFAKMAEDRIDETKNYPPVPYDYFAWLKKILPESNKNR
jgi:outer membrane protein assembly factor BamD (BamD/ComL family)